jgi:uncharacterized membrane protein
MAKGMKKRVNKFMELFWLALAIIAFIMAIYMIRVRGWEAAWHYLVFPLLAGAMYGLRRKLGAPPGTEEDS